MSQGNDNNNLFDLDFLNNSNEFTLRQTSQIEKNCTNLQSNPFVDITNQKTNLNQYSLNNLYKDQLNIDYSKNNTLNNPFAYFGQLQPVSKQQQTNNPFSYDLNYLQQMSQQKENVNQQSNKITDEKNNQNSSASDFQNFDFTNFSNFTNWQKKSEKITIQLQYEGKKFPITFQNDSSPNDIKSAIVAAAENLIEGDFNIIDAESKNIIPLNQLHQLKPNQKYFVQKINDSSNTRNEEFSRKITIEVDPFQHIETKKAIELMKKGSVVFKKTHYKGSLHNRFLILSKDQTTLCWLSKSKLPNQCSFQIKNIKEIKVGQKTEVFNLFPNSDLVHLSFSIMYQVPDEEDLQSLDLVCRTEMEYDYWLCGLKALAIACQNKLVSKLLLLSHCRIFQSLIKENQITDSSNFFCNQNYYTQNNCAMSYQDTLQNTSSDIKYLQSNLLVLQDKFRQTFMKVQQFLEKKYKLGLSYNSSQNESGYVKSWSNISQFDLSGPENPKNNQIKQLFNEYEPFVQHLLIDWNEEVKQKMSTIQKDMETYTESYFKKQNVQFDDLLDIYNGEYQPPIKQMEKRYENFLHFCQQMNIQMFDLDLEMSSIRMFVIRLTNEDFGKNNNLQKKIAFKAKNMQSNLNQITNGIIQSFGQNSAQQNSIGSIINDIKEGISTAATELGDSINEVKNNVVETIQNVKLEDVSKPISELINFKNIFE